MNKDHIAQLLSIEDHDMAALYQQWSENFYSAGWLDNGEEAFIEYLLDAPMLYHRPLEDYQKQSVNKIREILMDHLGDYQ